MPSRDADGDKPSEEADEALAYYKSQIQQLEAELNDFQASSRELEQELEKELEASERQHRELRDKNEGLRYEVEEWKNKYKQSKAEANSAQTSLQKEVTTLRESNRTIQLRLRDIEVSNDDFERQERIVQSSLEELESKYNSSIERGVMLEAEIQIGEQEREGLRIELQRLRDELSDLKVEQEITVEKLDKAMAMAAKYGNGSLHHVPPPTTYHSSLSETSSISGAQSPTTTQSTSTSTPQSEHSPTPPSPPISEVSATASQSSRVPDPALTPRPSHYQQKSRHRGHSRGPAGPEARGGGGGGGGGRFAMPQSKSLHQIRGLIGQMQRLEQRVQHARSKLPAPVNTPPRSSPRNLGMGGGFIPPTVTMRSHKKHRPSSTTSSVTSGGVSGGEQDSFRHVTRLSFGQHDRPASRSALQRPESRSSAGRPSSRASGTTSRSSVGTSSIPQRPQSRASVSGRVTPLGIHPNFDMSSIKRGGYGYGAHGDNEDVFVTPTMRRNTLSRHESTATATAAGSGIPMLRRSLGTARRISGDEDTGIGNVGLRRPQKKLSGVGETY